MEKYDGICNTDDIQLRKLYSCIDFLFLAVQVIMLVVVMIWLVTRLYS